MMNLEPNKTKNSVKLGKTHVLGNGGNCDGFGAEKKPKKNSVKLGKTHVLGRFEPHENKRYWDDSKTR